MTIRDMIDSGIVIQGQIKIQCWGNEDLPDVYYEGNIDFDGTKAIRRWLDREIEYIYPYVVCVGRVTVGAICIEVESEEEYGKNV